MQATDKPDLADFFACGVEPADVSARFPHLAARELEMHFGFLDPVKLETVLKRLRLREHSLLAKGLPPPLHRLATTMLAIGEKGEQESYL